MWPGGAEDKSLLPKMGPWAPQVCARHCTILVLYTLSYLILRGTQRRGNYCFHFRGKQTVSGVMCSFKAKQPANGAIFRFRGFPDDHLGAQVIEARIRRASTLHPLVATGHRPLSSALLYAGGGRRCSRPLVYLPAQA